MLFIQSILKVTGTSVKYNASIPLKFKIFLIDFYLSVVKGFVITLGGQVMWTPTFVNELENDAT